MLAALDTALSAAICGEQARRIFRLGMGDSLTQSGYTRAIARCMARPPSPMALELHVGNASQLEEMVLERKLDAAILYIPSHWPNLVYKEIFRELVHFVTHASNVAGDVGAAELLKSLGVVVPTLQLNRHRGYLDQILGAHFETRYPIRAMTDGILPARALLEAGVGAGFLQAHLIGSRPDPAVWYCFEGWQRQHRAYLVYEAELRQDASMRALIKRIEEALAKA